MSSPQPPSSPVDAGKPFVFSTGTADNTAKTEDKNEAGSTATPKSSSGPGAFKDAGVPAASGAASAMLPMELMHLQSKRKEKEVIEDADQTKRRR